MRILSLETFRLGLSNLRLHKLRSVLTSLGIIFGVAAVICMLSISEGASADEMRMIELLGTQNIIVNSVKPPQTQAASGNTALVEYGITHEDVAIIENTLPHIAHVVPMKTVSYRVRHGAYQATMDVVGTTPAFFDVVNIKVSTGRALTDQDLDTRANVCVIGEDVRKALFPFKDPIGEVVLAERFPNAVPTTVVGILESVKTAGAPARGVEERNLNREVLLPFSTAVAQFGETTRRMTAGGREFIKMQYSGLYVNVDDIQHVILASKDVQRVLEHGHRERDFEVKVPLARLELARKKKRNNQLTLGFIAGISLLVGGIGIMNIMLATVTERTREIGIRRALGARRRHITVQFLIETVLLSTCGGVLGVGLGVVGAYFVNTFAEWETIVSIWSVVVSFSLSVFVGIFFGMYPAMSAARLDPIEALRYE
ncbi:MAG: ABC transporter permease [Phycisphaerales bacterium]|nr:MAG: ABC transporter permease [Phycisphaerales bacterium]